MTHAQQIINYIKEHGGITKSECDSLGINNFYEKIYAIKKSGAVNIITVRDEHGIKTYKIQEDASDGAASTKNYIKTEDRSAIVYIKNIKNKIHIFFENVKKHFITEK